MTCPICGNQAEKRGDRDYGDKKRYDCPRCGPFEISGTALSMLDGRLSAESNARARLSHAVRLEPKKESEWFMVTSANLDELVSRTLPDLDRQLIFLLSWISAQLGDDPLGRVQPPNSEDLAGVVGAVNGERVDRLLQHAERMALIEYPHMGALGLTPKGLEMVRGRSTRPASAEGVETEEIVTGPQEVEGSDGHNENEVVTANCNNCGGERKAFLRRSYTVRGDEDDVPVSWSDTIEILECCGCSELSVQHKHWFSEWDDFDIHPISGEEVYIPGVRTRMWPPASKRIKPDWADQIKDENLRTAMDEVYIALDHDLVVLAAIGTRTLLDRAMFLRVGDPAGGFGRKLAAMVQERRINEEEKNTLEVMVDVGSAAAHRAHIPSLGTLNRVLTATETLLLREFIIPDEAKEVRDATPKRSVRNK